MDPRHPQHLRQPQQGIPPAFFCPASSELFSLTFCKVFITTGSLAFGHFQGVGLNGYLRSFEAHPSNNICLSFLTDSSFLMVVLASLEPFRPKELPKPLPLGGQTNYRWVLLIIKPAFGVLLPGFRQKWEAILEGTTKCYSENS